MATNSVIPAARIQRLVRIDLFTVLRAFDFAPDLLVALEAFGPTQLFENPVTQNCLDVNRFAKHVSGSSALSSIQREQG